MLTNKIVSIGLCVLALTACSRKSNNPTPPPNPPTNVEDTLALGIAPSVALTQCTNGRANITLTHNGAPVSTAQTLDCQSTERRRAFVINVPHAAAGDHIALTIQTTADAQPIALQGVLFATGQSRTYAAGLSAHSTQVATTFQFFSAADTAQHTACIQHTLALLARFALQATPVIDLNSTHEAIATVVRDACATANMTDASRWIENPQVLLSQMIDSAMGGREAWNDNNVASEFYRHLFESHPLKENMAFWQDRIATPLHATGLRATHPHVDVIHQQATSIAQYLFEKEAIDAAFTNVTRTDAINTLITEWRSQWQGTTGYLHTFVPYDLQARYTHFLAHFELATVYAADDVDLLIDGRMLTVFYPALDAVMPGAAKAALALRVGQRALKQHPNNRDGDVSNETTVHRRGVHAQTGGARNYTVREALGLVALTAALQTLADANAYENFSWYFAYGSFDPETFEIIPRKTVWENFLNHPILQVPAAFRTTGSADPSDDFWENKAHGQLGTPTNLLNYLAYVKADLDVVLFDTDAARPSQALHNAMVLDQFMFGTEDDENLSLYHDATIASDSPFNVINVYNELQLTHRLANSLQLLVIDHGGVAQ